MKEISRDTRHNITTVLIQREPNGRIKRRSRKEDPAQTSQLKDQPMKTVMEQRVKFFGATKDNFRSQLWTDQLGRLHLFKFISDDQYNAGKKYQEATEEYRYTHGIPKGVPKCFDLRSVSGSGEAPDIDPDRKRRAKEEYSLMRDFLEERGWEVSTQTDALVIWDCSLTNDHMIGNIREGLNALHRYCEKKYKYR